MLSSTGCSARRVRSEISGSEPRNSTVTVFMVCPSACWSNVQSLSNGFRKCTHDQGIRALSPVLGSNSLLPADAPSFFGLMETAGTHTAFRLFGFHELERWLLGAAEVPGLLWRSAPRVVAALLGPLLPAAVAVGFVDLGGGVLQ